MKKKGKMISIITISLLVIVFGLVRAKHISPIAIGVYDKVNQNVFSDNAINGYDPVAYFSDQKAIKGNKEFETKWNGATWNFKDESNLNLFKSNPEKYAPQYGGYCTFAVSKGFTANTSPESFMINNDKLYLFSEDKFKEEFNDDLNQKAANNWAKVN